MIPSRNPLQRSWINLITVAGAPGLRDQMRRLDGPLEADSPLLNDDEFLANILRDSP